MEIVKALIIGTIGSLIGAFIIGFFISHEYMRKQNEKFTQWRISRSKKKERLYYSKLAKGNIYNFQFYLIYVLLFLNIIVIVPTVFYLNAFIETNKRNYELIVENKGKSNEELEKILRIGSIEDIKDDAIEFGENKWKFKTIILMLVIMYFILLSSIFSDSLEKEIINRKIRRLNDDLIVLKPYIGDKKADVLRSLWCSMTNKKEYDRIMRLIDNGYETRNETIKKEAEIEEINKLIGEVPENI